MAPSVVFNPLRSLKSSWWSAQPTRIRATLILSLRSVSVSSSPASLRSSGPYCVALLLALPTTPCWVVVGCLATSAETPLRSSSDAGRIHRFPTGDREAVTLLLLLEVEAEGLPCHPRTIGLELVCTAQVAAQLGIPCQESRANLVFGSSRWSAEPSQARAPSPVRHKV